METKLRQRVIGGIVLAALAIIFLPLLFKGNNLSPIPKQVPVSEDIPKQPPKPSATNLPDIQTTDDGIMHPQDKNKVVTLTKQGDSLVATVNEPSVDSHTYSNTLTNTKTQTPNTPKESEKTNNSPVGFPQNQIQEFSNPIPSGGTRPAKPQTKSITVEPTSQTKTSPSGSELNVTEENNISQTLNSAEDKVLSIKNKPVVLDKTKREAIVLAKAQKAKAITLGAWAVQLGSFQDELRAKSLVKQLQTKGFAAYLAKIKTGNGTMTRVLIGPETKKSKAEVVLTRLDKEMQLKGVIVPFDVKIFK